MHEETHEAVKSKRISVREEANWLMLATDMKRQQDTMTSEKIEPGTQRWTIPRHEGNTDSENVFERIQGFADTCAEHVQAAPNERAKERALEWAFESMRTAKAKGTPEWRIPEDWTRYGAGWRATWTDARMDIDAVSKTPGIEVGGWRKPKRMTGPRVMKEYYNSSRTVGTVLIYDGPRLGSDNFGWGDGPTAATETRDDLLLLWAKNEFGVAPLILRIKINPTI